MKTSRVNGSEINLVLGGEAGQGLQTIAQIMARMFISGGLHVLAVSEFMSRIRGGSNSVTLRAASTPVRALSGTVDLCVCLDSEALPRLRSRCTRETLLIGDPTLFVNLGGSIPRHLWRFNNQLRLQIPRACGGVIHLFFLPL